MIPTTRVKKVRKVLIHLRCVWCGSHEGVKDYKGRWDIREIAGELWAWQTCGNRCFYALEDSQLRGISYDVVGPSRGYCLGLKP